MLGVDVGRAAAAPVSMAAMPATTGDRRDVELEVLHSMFIITWISMSLGGLAVTRAGKPASVKASTRDDGIVPAGLR